MHTETPLAHALLLRPWSLLFSSLSSTSPLLLTPVTVIMGPGILPEENFSNLDDCILCISGQNATTQQTHYFGCKQIENRHILSPYDYSQETTNGDWWLLIWLINKSYDVHIVLVFVCVCCVSLLHLSCVSDFIQFVFIRAVFSAVFSLTVLSGLLFLLIDFFLCCCPWQIKIHSFIHSLI